jgi:hypothetical protein
MEDEVLSLFSNCGGFSLNGHLGDPISLFRLIRYVYRDRGLSRKYLRKLLFLLSSYRIDGDCGEGLVSSLSVYSRSFRRIVSGFFKSKYEEVLGVVSDLLDKIGSKSIDYVIIFSNVGDAYFIRRFSRWVRNLGISITVLNVPDLMHMLNISHIFGYNVDLSGLSSLLRDIKSNIVLCDSYDVSLFKSILGIDAIPLYRFFGDLLENYDVFVEMMPELKIGLVTPYLSLDKDDFNGYIGILDNVGTIDYVASKIGVWSQYVYEYSLFKHNSIGDMKTLFDDDLKILVTFDPYIYCFMEYLARRELVLVGYLPNMLIRFMRRS